MTPSEKVNAIQVALGEMTHKETRLGPMVMTTPDIMSEAIRTIAGIVGPPDFTCETHRMPSPHPGCTLAAIPWAEYVDNNCKRREANEAL